MLLCFLTWFRFHDASSWSFTYIDPLLIPLLYCWNNFGKTQSCLKPTLSKLGLMFRYQRSCTWLVRNTQCHDQKLKWTLSAPGQSYYISLGRFFSLTLLHDYFISSYLSLNIHNFSLSHSLLIILLLIPQGKWSKKIRESFTGSHHQI